MSALKDPGIKLFGKTIPLPEVFPSAPMSSPLLAVAADDNNNNKLDQDQDPPSHTNSFPEDNAGQDIETEKETVDENPDDDEVLVVASEENHIPDSTPGTSEKAKSCPVGEEVAEMKTTNTEEEKEPSDSQEKPLKKPDKILPCPRCNSMDTKFCYYNNYNVNQPRYFCKNCQRYWTAGGTMRNVPVGAGRRKNKNPSSHDRLLTMPEALQNSRPDIANGPHHHPLMKTNGTVFTFGSETGSEPESMVSALNLADKNTRNCTGNSFQKPDELKVQASYDQTPNPKDEAGKCCPQDQQTVQRYPVFPPQMPCFPPAPWPYPWNSCPMPPPPFFPMPFYPSPPYWGCPPPTGPWNIPWVVHPPSPNQPASVSGPNSPTLGKHSRDEKASGSGEEPVIENNDERCLWIPKTLRIDDPGEAAKSSIWESLGIKDQNTDSISRGLFKSFQPKKNHVDETSPVLQANPAALSRSIKFHESS